MKNNTRIGYMEPASYFPKNTKLTTKKTAKKTGTKKTKK